MRSVPYQIYAVCSKYYSISGDNRLSHHFRMQDNLSSSTPNFQRVQSPIAHQITLHNRHFALAGAQKRAVAKQTTQPQALRRDPVVRDEEVPRHI